MTSKQKNTNIKIYYYLQQISNIRKTSQKIQIFLELLNYLLNNDECIKLLQENNILYKTIKNHYYNDLYDNIDENEYNKINRKLLQIKKNTIISYEYLDNGNKINTLNL